MNTFKITLLFLSVSFVTFSSCNKKVKGCMDPASTNFNSKATEDDGSCTYAPKTLGQSFGGGFVFYVDATGQHGLVAAPVDQGNSRGWHNSIIIATGATGSAVGTGQSNTTAIVNTQGAGPYAAKICDDLVSGGFSDWFLPSKDELNLMYTNLHLKSIGNTAFARSWSSTEINTDDAMSLEFNSGTWTQVNKITTISVRAARKF